MEELPENHMFCMMGVSSWNILLLLLFLLLLFVISMAYENNKGNIVYLANLYSSPSVFKNLH